MLRAEAALAKRGAARLSAGHCRLPCRGRLVAARSMQTKEEAQRDAKTDAQETTEKYGLEAGLLKVLTSKDEGDASPGLSRTEQAKQLLTQYGSAYLLTSISFAIVSFALCYGAVTAGVDVAALLAKIGLQVNSTNEAVGTFAIAYAAHKALSPVRFPPTVALTPVVARYLGKGAKPQDPQQGSS